MQSTLSPTSQGLDALKLSQANSKRWALIICTISGFVTPFMGSSVTIAMPRIGAEFGMAGVFLAWVATSYNLTAAMFLLPLGRIADIKGREIVFRIGLFLFALFSLGCGLSWNASSLLAFRFLQGISGGMIFGTSGAILAAYYPRHERGKAFGVYTAALYFGNSFGPALGGVVTQYVGWRGILGIATVLALSAAVLATCRLPNRAVDPAAKLDMPGASAYAVALLLLMLGLSKLPQTWAEICVAAGFLGLALFGYIEMKSASPVLNIRTFRSNRPFIFANLTELIGITTTFAVAFLLNLYLQNVKGLSPAKAGLTLVTLSLTTAVVSTIAGKVSDKVHPSIIATIGMAITALGLGSLIFLNASTSMTFIMGCTAFLGVGVGMFASPVTQVVISSAGKKDFGVASASLTTMRTLGMNLAMGIILMLFSLMLGSTRITPEFAGPFVKCLGVAFIVFTALTVLGVYTALPRGRGRRGGHSLFLVSDDLGYGLLVIPDDCDGCLSCKRACQRENNYPEGKSGIRVIEKVPQFTELCDMCAAHVKRGELPACVENCKAGCIHFGEVNELTKESTDRPKKILAGSR